MIDYDFDSIASDELYRLCDEHLRLQSLADSNPDLMQYTPGARHKLAPHPPVEYEIRYTLRSIVGTAEDRTPVYGDEHKLKILLPREYPLGPAECRMTSDTWHPNIKSDGDFKGNICTNHGGFGTLYYLDELVVRIGEFLQYKRYLAEDKKPFPEDQKVARWVRDFAEPNGIVDKDQARAIDDRPWKWLPPDLNDNPDEIIIEEITDSSTVGATTEDGDDIQFI